MTTITTKLIKDGNSLAVRLPKTVLALSGLRDTVKMEVRQGQITLRAVRSPRGGWKEQIARVAATNPAATALDEELTDWETTDSDGLDKKY